MIDMDESTLTRSPLQPLQPSLNRSQAFLARSLAMIGVSIQLLAYPTIATHLTARFLNPAPFPPASPSVSPSTSKAYFDVTRAPALRLFAVCRPVWREGTVSRGRRGPRRRRMAVGRVRVWAPPHWWKYQ